MASQDELLKPYISTGQLPPTEQIRRLLQEAYDLYKDNDEGQNADYIPALANTPRHLFGVCLASVKGEHYALGDEDYEFSIQSISKPFVFALVCQAIGVDEIRDKIGLNNTGMPFNSVIALELNERRLANPMVNGGAIATTSLVPGDTAEAKWQFIQDGLARFAGRRLSFNAEVYASETATNQRNRGIAMLMASYNRMYFDPLVATDIYTKQCSLNITVRDLAVMGSTLANGGINPITGERVIEAALCKRVLAVMATAGLYERSGEWLYDIGLPGKSGVSGGIVTISPGKGGLGVFAPPLDGAGNSIKGQLVTRFLSDRLGLNLFTSTPTL
ncbi:MAG: glutaminase A [Aggregatilineales bacterium]